MRDEKVRKDDTYCEFIELFKLEDLELSLSQYKGSKEYDAVLRYYFACIGKLELSRLLEPLALLKQSLEPMRTRIRVRRNADSQLPENAPQQSAPGLSQICEKTARFETRLQHSVEQLKTAPTEVPKIMHFVWLGGGLGDIQRDYLNIWKKVLAAKGYTLNLWYDSDALLAYQTNKLIVEAAKADAHQHSAGQSLTEDALATLYEQRAMVLKQQMFAHINAGIAAGHSADDARIDLLTRAYGQDSDALQALIGRNLLSLVNMGESDMQLRDIGDLQTPMVLQDIYDQETRLRGNLAAASDVVRVHALASEGGCYADVDNLPPLAGRLGTTELAGWKSDARSGALQLLLDHNPDWTPGRQALRARYTSYFESIPEAHRAPLEAFAKSHPSIDEVFQVPADRLARPNELRAVAEFSSLSNAFLMAHPRAAMVDAMIQRIRFNYEILGRMDDLVRQRRRPPNDFHEVAPVAEEVLEQVFGPLAELPADEHSSAGQLLRAVASYFSDGIRRQSEGTIHLTGPGAMRCGMKDYSKQHWTPAAADTLLDQLAIAPAGTVTRDTEEEKDHSWKDNATNSKQWLADEQARWQQGEFATRYNGDIAQLLKHSTVEFQSGWPVIEGRAVLLTDVLQRLADDLGEPFVEALRTGHDGEITFERLLPLGFDDRQAIKAQPESIRLPAFLNDPQLTRLGLDVVLNRIAEDTLHIAQTSPLQRLAVGQLIGAQSLDSQSFMQLHSELDNLANSVGQLGTSNRYAAIERQLYKRRPPGFLAGLASIADAPPVLTGDALALKKSAMLNAHTPYQWGRHVAQIQKLATLEHREQVLERVGQVLQHFEAASVKLIPQDLLLQGPGDVIAGRCYPLALAMSAALTKGDQASRRLRERFYLAVVEPEQSDSVAFLDALEEMRDVQMSDVGESRGRADLAEICSRLNESHGNLSLMLNSDNHVLLVAKTVAAQRSTLHFFDPNFGLFEFADAAMFQRALHEFLVTRGMAGYYAAFGKSVRPTFDLIELQDERLVAIALPVGLKVGQLLESDSLPGRPSKLPIRRRLSSARGRTLSNNAHLGRCLRELDSRWWAQQIADVTVGLQGLQGAVKPWVPLFESLEITPESNYRITLADPLDATRTTQVVSTDHRLLRIKQWLTEQFSTLARKPQDAVSAPEMTEAGAVHTLNAGFAIQALVFALREREGDGRTLSLSVRLHAYVNYAQLAHGLVADAAGLMKLYSTALNEEKAIARTCAPVVSEALGHVANEGVGTVLGLANVGFDVYQLATATDDRDIARYGTQLAFDSASFAAGLAGLGTAAAGAATAAAFLGGAGVMLGGLAVGVAALAEGFANIAEEAKQVGLFFDHLEKACRGDGYRFDAALQAWVVDPPSLFVESVDLIAGKLLLGNQKLFRLRDHFGVPDTDPDDTRAINIREQLGFSSQIKIQLPVGQRIVLPCTPQTFYDYEYKALPFASWRHDAGFDTARRLEKRTRDGQWLFLFTFYSFPTHYIVHRLFPGYRATTLRVRLDANERQLVVPQVPHAWHGLLTYELTGAGSTCVVQLNAGVSLELHAPSQSRCRWILNAGWAGEQAVSFEDGGLLIDGIRVRLTGKGVHEVVVSLADRRVFSVNRVGRRLDVLEDTAPAGLDEQALLDHYKQLAREHRLALPYTPVNNYLIPFESAQEPRYTKAWYDAHEDRFLYVRDESVLEADDAALAVVADGSAYFYQPNGYLIWQVDVVSGLLQHRYRLLVMPGTGSILRIDADAQGRIHVVQQYVEAASGARQFGYLLHERNLSLCSVIHNLPSDVRVRALAGETLTDWKGVLGDYLQHSGLPPQDGDTTVEWWPAPYVSVCWPLTQTQRDMVWVRRHDRLLINPLPASGAQRGWADSIKKLDQLTLLVPADNQDVFVVYDRLAQRLCRLQRTLSEGQGAWSSTWIEPERLKQVMLTESGYVATTEDGLFFNLTVDGQLQFGGLAETWLHNRPRWWQALDAVWQRHPVERFAIVGLHDPEGEAYLFAWYINEQLLLCETARDERISLLGLTPDKRRAWLFEASCGEIRAVTLVAPERLEQAFASGSQPLRRDALVTPQQEWEDWRFATVALDGAGLKGTTVEGVELALRFEETERVTGVNHAWVVAQGEQLVQRLQALLDTVEHDCFVAIESAPGVRQWFDVQNLRLIQVPDKGLHDDVQLLGTQHRSRVLLHDRQDGFVLSYPDQKRFGPFEHIQRDAAVMVIEGQKRVVDPASLLPDDVNTLVLRMGQGGVTYHLSNATWIGRDAIVVDCRPSPGDAQVIPGKLNWSLAEPRKLQLDIVGEHLVVSDPDREQCLILRDVCSQDPALRGEVYLGFDGWMSMPVSQLIFKLQRQAGAAGGATLEMLRQETVTER